MTPIQAGYLTGLTAAYGAPSQQGFGSAVFHETLKDTDDLTNAALSKYQAAQSRGQLYSQSQAHDRPEAIMAAPLAIPIVARVVFFGAVAGAIAAVGWMIHAIQEDDEKQRRRRLRDQGDDDGEKGRQEDS
jgi:hypothetical protein